MKVLALSHTYEPLGVIRWEKAVTLAFSGKVQILSEYENEVHSPSLSMKIPSVVVFKHNRKHRVKSVRFSRKNVWIRDCGVCQYCGKKVSVNEFTLDHVVPKKHEGKTVWTNVVTCCYTCNQKKADKTVSQAGMKLLKPVVKPTVLPYIQDVEFYYDFAAKMPDSWRFWIGDHV